MAICLPYALGSLIIKLFSSYLYFYHLRNVRDVVSQPEILDMDWRLCVLWVLNLKVEMEERLKKQGDCHIIASALNHSTSSGREGEHFWPRSIYGVLVLFIKAGSPGRQGPFLRLCMFENNESPLKLLNLLYLDWPNRHSVGSSINVWTLKGRAGFTKNTIAFRR